MESRKKNGVPIVENVPIRLRVVFDGQRIEFTTGYRIDAAKWDTAIQRVKNGCSNKLRQSASEVNTDLLKYYTEIQEIFKRFEVMDVMPTPEQVKFSFNSLHKPIEEAAEPVSELKIGFLTAFDEFVKDCGVQNNWTHATYEKFAAVKNHLMTFKNDLTFYFFDEHGDTQ